MVYKCVLKDDYFKHFIYCFFEEMCNYPDSLIEYQFDYKNRDDFKHQKADENFITAWDKYELVIGNIGKIKFEELSEESKETMLDFFKTAFYNYINSYYTDETEEFVSMDTINNLCEFELLDEIPVSDYINGNTYYFSPAFKKWLCV